MTNAVKMETSEWLAGGQHETGVFKTIPHWLEGALRNNVIGYASPSTDYVVLTKNMARLISNGDDPHNDPDHLYPGDYIVQMEDGTLFILKEKRVLAVPEEHRNLAIQTLMECTRISPDFLNTLFPV